MDDIDMNSINQIEEDSKTNQEEDPCVALDNIQKKLKTITETFSESLNYIKNYSPFIPIGNDTLEQEIPEKLKIGSKTKVSTEIETI